MKKIYTILTLLFSIFTARAEASFFALNLSGKILNCALRNEKEKLQLWSIEKWENEETILLDNNVPAGEYFIWTADNDEWTNTKQSVVLDDGKIYCLSALQNNIFKLEELSFVSNKADVAAYLVINRSKYQLKNVKFSSNFEKDSANYFNGTNYKTSLFPVKEGKWNVFWEYDDLPDNYFALQDNLNTKNNKACEVTIEKSNAYLLILLPEKADFMRLGTFTFPYK